jgi:hypothetical protein
MTDNKINEAIATVCGWSNIKTSGRLDGQIVGYPPTNSIIGKPCSIPNYCEDLNEMHEAEKELDVESAEGYAALLHAATSTRHSYGFNCFQALSSTARQRAEAFLIVKGLWQK